MQKILIAIAIFGCTLTNVSAQLSLGLRLGMSPSVDPGTSQIFVNSGSQENLFNAQQVRYAPQIGVAARADMEHFWFMTELKYSPATTRYSMLPTQQYTESRLPAAMYSVRRDMLELPVSAGVKLGIVEIFSGFFLDADLHVKNDLAQMAGFVSSAPAVRAGWHSGIGVNLGNVLFDVRYQQEFSNYGQGYYFNGQELLLHNAPGRLIMTIGYTL